MVEQLVHSVRTPSAWLPPDAENDAYEGIRRGEEAAFRAVAQPLQPVLHRLARLTVRSTADADAVIGHTWELALRGLGMFCWHTPFATWVAGIAVAHLRATHDAAPPDPFSPPQAVPPAPGPADWSDLPWAARWERALPTLVAAQAALPLAEREVVHTRDGEQWPSRRVCDVLGLPETAYERLLADGRTRLRAALAPLVGEGDAGPHLAAQRTAVARALALPVDHAGEPLDPRTVAVFRSWRGQHLTGWRRLGVRLRHPLG